MNVLLSIFLFLLISPIDAFSQSTSNEITTFILVRHAEKVDDSRDPDLSEAGYKRADILANMMENISFDAVYSTPMIRTTETAREIAEKNGVEIINYDHLNPDEVAAEWIGKHRGNHVLIAGHSNSTPTFANALLGREHFKKKFDESDFGNILIVTITSDGETNLLHMRY
ncbi:MAG: phosphoglycerate mutase family protein [Balneolaceae bacterium]